ncbi:MAG: hypothetical protein ACXIVQ_16835 [Acidimicrobiales bacterium]
MKILDRDDSCPDGRIAVVWGSVVVSAPVVMADGPVDQVVIALDPDALVMWFWPAVNLDGS